MSQLPNSPYGDIFPEEQLQVPGQYRVSLASVGNPDFGQDPSRALFGAAPDQWQEVGSIADAASACLRFIDENELGGGNWAGGDVVDATGRTVARVSYNGRVWLPGATG